MTVLQHIHYLSLVVFAILAGAWFYGKKSGKWQFISGKIVLYSLAITIALYIIFIVAGLFFGNPANEPNTTTEQSSSSVSPSSSSSSSKEQSSNSEEDGKASTILSKMSTTKLKEYNDDLLSSLNEDQGYANSGKKDYAYTTYIDTLAYDQNRGLIVEVNSDFTTLSDAQKAIVANGAQKLAVAQSVLSGSDELTDNSAPLTNIYYNGNKIGHAKFTNTSEFKWSK